MWRDLLQPSTDLGVAVQGLVLGVAIGVGLWATRGRREWRILVIGLALVLLGLFGLRAAH